MSGEDTRSNRLPEPRQETPLSEYLWLLRDPADQGAPVSTVPRAAIEALAAEDGLTVRFEEEYLPGVTLVSAYLDPAPDASMLARIRARREAEDTRSGPTTGGGRDIGTYGMTRGTGVAWCAACHRYSWRADWDYGDIHTAGQFEVCPCCGEGRNAAGLWDGPYRFRCPHPLGPLSDPAEQAKAAVARRRVGPRQGLR